MFSLHQWVGMLASFEFTLEYQKGADKGVADALSHIPICHNHETIWSLLEGAIMGAVDRGEAKVSKKLLGEHRCLGSEVWVQATRKMPMHIVDWTEAQEVDPMLAACRRWLLTHKDTPFPMRDALLRKYLGDNANTEEGCALFCVCNSLIMSKGLLYVSTMPKGEVEGILAFLVLTDQCCAALNGVHHDTGHQSQQRTLVLMQERFCWLMMVEDCRALVGGCQLCCIFEGAIPKAPMWPIRAHMPLELTHIDFTSMELTMELNKPPSIKNVLVITDHFIHYAFAFVMKDQTAKTVAKVLYEQFIAVFGAPSKVLLSDHGMNFTLALVKELCAPFGIQKCWTTAYHVQCNGQVEKFHQTLFRMIGKLAANKKAQ